MTRLLGPRATMSKGASVADSTDTIDVTETEVTETLAQAVRGDRRRRRSGAESRIEYNGRRGQPNMFALDEVLRANNADGSAEVERSDPERDASTDGDTDGDGPPSGPRLLDFPPAPGTAGDNQLRWTPIGPSVVRLGQAEAIPNVTGRITDLAVSPNGQRIYAASAKGGLWYSADSGATWDPVGNWNNPARGAGGNLTGLVIGSILVHFGPTAAQDHVVVGTGELRPFTLQSGAGRFGGVGILEATGPANWSTGTALWSATTGTVAAPNALVGVGVFRIVHRPRVLADGANPVATNNVIVACTSGGTFVGRKPVGGGAYQWSQIALPAVATDAVWIPSGGQGRLYLALQGGGVVYSDNVITPPVGGPTTQPVGGVGYLGRGTLATNTNQSRVYVLGRSNAANPPTVNVWQITSPASAAPAVTQLSLPAGVNPFGSNSSDYAHALEVSGTGANDHIFLAGDTVYTSNWVASVWAFTPSGANLVAIPQISNWPWPSAAAPNAGLTGLVGNTVHPDVHALRIRDIYRGAITNVVVNSNMASITVASTAGLSVGDIVVVNATTPGAGGVSGSFELSAVTPTTISYSVQTADVASMPSAGSIVARDVWVGCDGGVYKSSRAGAQYTFVHRNAGLAVIEAGYVANHPTSRHYTALGAQDNGVETRVGETVWELIMAGDGGGVAFHGTASQDILGQYVQQTWNVRPNGSNPQFTLPQQSGAEWYSGCDALGQQVAAGTDLVAISNNPRISGDMSTWQVLPNIANSGSAARPANSAGAAAFGSPAGMGRVVTVKWADNNNLLALYQNGVVRYTNAGANIWNSSVVLAIPTVPTSPIASDLAPDPGQLGSFYLTTVNRWSVPDPNNPGPLVADTCFYYDSTAPILPGRLFPAGLDAQLVGELDPATAVVVDAPPGPNTQVYVGTAVGVWRGVRAANRTHAWTAMVNGTPDAVVQDLAIWSDPADASAPRLLRAALQSRGIWEVDLRTEPNPNPALQLTEPRRTYVRTHTWDGRRQFPTPLKNPRRKPSALNLAALASPDIKIRPDVPSTPPRWRGMVSSDPDFRSYQLWTFQTAFRWRYPSVVANGKMSKAFEELVNRERAVLGLGGTGIDRTLWEDVVGDSDPAGRLYVYRAPWTDSSSPNLPATEADIIDLIRPREQRRERWGVYREPSVVEVLLHHRDVRPIDPTAGAPEHAYALLLWKSGPDAPSVMNADTSEFITYARSLAGGGAPNDVPDGWNVARPADPLHRLGVPLSARLPRSVPIELDLSIGNGANQVPLSHKRVIAVALVGSDVDPFQATVAGGVSTDTPEALVRNWPHAAARYFRVFTRS